MDELAARLDKLHTMEAHSDIAGVVGQLREHAADAGFQKYGWTALFGLIPQPGGGLKNAQTEVAMKAGAMELSVAALQTHLKQEDVVLAVCAVLVRLVQGFGLEAGASGAIEAVLAAMHEHAQELLVQEQACRIVSSLATSFLYGGSLEEASRATAEVHARRAGDAGAVEIVLAALREFGTDFELEGVLALANLTRVNKNARRAADAGAVDDCVRILCSRKPEPETLRYLASVLTHTIQADPSKAAARAGDLGAVEAVVRLMRQRWRPADASSPVSSTFSLLQVLLMLADFQPNAARAWRAGAMPLLHAAKLEGIEQEIAETIIASLQDVKADAEAAADASAAELIAGEAAGAQAQPPSTCKKKKKRSKHPKPPSAPKVDEEEETPPDDTTQAGGAGDSTAAGPASELPSRPMCVICLDAAPCVLLLPCRHLPVCAAAECAAMLCGPCPLCRAPVTDTLTVFPL